MRNGAFIAGCVSLILGGAAGFFIAKAFYKKKYEKYADDEIASIKRVYEKHFGVNNDNQKDGSTPEKKQFISKTSLDGADGDESHITRKGKYVDYTAPYRSEDPTVKETRPTLEEKLEPKNIYILSPAEFRESTNPTVTLFYYKDGILADDDYNIIKKPEEIIGTEALSSFGRYEDDAVYVRNENNKTDYEILIDNRSYIDVSPHGSGAPSDDD